MSMVTLEDGGGRVAPMVILEDGRGWVVSLEDGKV